jgi:argininosuccinate lyase
MKGQPLAYNKDNQEDKEPLFDAVDTVTDTLRIFADMIPASPRPDNMRDALSQGFATATDLADYLTKQGPALPRCARGSRPGRQARRGTRR